MAGLAELESDLKKYGSLLWDFVVILHLLEVVLVQLQNHFEFEARNIETPKGTAIFFFASDSTSANPANSGPL